MGIDQLAATPISLIFRTKAFLDESEDLMSLDTHHIVFPRWHHRDGESFSRTISSTKRVTSLRSVNISRFVNKETDLDFVRTYMYHPVDRGSLLSLGSLSLASRVSNYHDYLSNSIIIIFALVNITSIA